MDQNEKKTEETSEATPEEAKKTQETPDPVEEEKVEEKAEEKDKKEKKFFHKEQKEIESLKKQLDEKNDQFLRVAAEYDNYRKRSEKEKSDCYAMAYGDALKAFLPLVDSMYQASQFSPDDKGIQALSKQLQTILDKLGIQEMKTDGETFNPVCHNAIMHEENPEVGENVITQTFQKGYLLGDKVLRPAMVKVAN